MGQLQGSWRQLWGNYGLIMSNIGELRSKYGAITGNYSTLWYFMVLYGTLLYFMVLYLMFWQFLVFHGNWYFWYFSVLQASHNCFEQHLINPYTRELKLIWYSFNPSIFHIFMSGNKNFLTHNPNLSASHLPLATLAGPCTRLHLTALMRLSQYQEITGCDCRHLLPF